MISAHLLSQIDHALRFAKERSTEPFGGINVIAAGDLCQFPPVKGIPLYSPLRSNTKASEVDFGSRLGWLVWKTFDRVVNFTEQKRMESDPEYAAAVARLRLRECTQADVDLRLDVLCKQETQASSPSPPLSQQDLFPLDRTSRLGDSRSPRDVSLSHPLRFNIVLTSIFRRQR